MKIPRKIIDSRIRAGYNAIPGGMKDLFRLKKGMSAAWAIERTFRSRDPEFGLRGLGKPAKDLLALEIGCENLDASKAAALAGIRRYDVNSVEITSMMAAECMLEAARLKVQEVPGPVERVFFTKDYDLFIACRMGRYFADMPIDTFTRLVHGNAVDRRAKRLYLFDRSWYYKEYVPFFAKLKDAGFRISGTWPSTRWFAVVAEMESVPGAVKIERDKNGFMIYSSTATVRSFEEDPESDPLLMKMMRKARGK